jgi:hypothetical protein
VWGLSLVEYDAATGAERSRSAYPQASGYYAPTLAVAPNGDFVVAGRSSDGTSIFVAAQDASHVPLFAQTYSQGVQGTQLAVNGAGQIVVSGPSAAALGNWVTLKLDRQGTLLQGPWVVDRTTRVAEAPRDLLVGSDGAATVVGAAGIPGSALADTQATTVRYAATGSVAWLATAPGARMAVDAALGKDGGVYVLADTDQTLLHYPAQVPVALAVPTGLSLSAASVKGGNTVQGQVVLSTNAGATVGLRSSHPSLVTVPASVVVPAGATTAALVVKTSRPRTSTAVTISATANGQTRSVVLTVTR